MYNACPVVLGVGIHFISDKVLKYLLFAIMEGFRPFNMGSTKV